MNDENTKKSLGQFFTRHGDVHTSMLKLVRHTTGRALEPSCGEGHLVAVLEEHRPGLELTAVEFDTSLEPVCDTTVVFDDFFAFAAKTPHFDVVFGNPPYVAWKEVLAPTRASAAAVKAPYSDKANLYHLFIDRCIDLLTPGGELVFIVPKEWLYTTSAAPLRAKITATGAITHLVDCGEDKLFSDASVPALLIFRFEKGAKGDLTYYPTLAAHLADEPQERRLLVRGERWILLSPQTAELVSDWDVLGAGISVKVGLVTGLDAAFKLPAGSKVSRRYVSEQVTTKRTAERFLDANACESFDALPRAVREHLEPHQEALLARRIARFDETNWWRYGAIRNAEAMGSSTRRVYALAKTRANDPFFTHSAKHFTGGVLGLFLSELWEGVGEEEIVRLLNSALFRELLVGMFLTSADKVSLQPATLHDVPFPTGPEQLSSVLEMLDQNA
jgi:adenine-specific DNA-methyltransferase